MSNIGTIFVETDCDASLTVNDNAVFGSTLYSNPEKDYVFTDALNVTSYTIFDILGKMVSNSSVNSDSSIYLGNLKKGIYFVEIQNINNNSQSFKIIKK